MNLQITPSKCNGQPDGDGQNGDGLRWFYLGFGACLALALALGIYELAL